LLREGFGFHPLAVEDSEHFGQRSKLEEYDGFVFLVVYGWAPDEDGLVEVHCFFSERFLVTVHRDECPVWHDLQERYELRGAPLPEGVLLLYEIVDRLVDSFFPPLETVAERLDVIEEDMLGQPREEHLRDISTMHRRLTPFRRVIATQRDLFGRVSTGGAELPGMTPDAERHFRDVYDHLVRLSHTIDGYRELMNEAIDVYLSSSSHRLNAVMKQLAVIATVFLPMSFVAGFFGQNFGWMVDHVGSLAAFLILGVGTQLLTIGLLVLYFRRREWF
jgi:magnesium transporter